MKSVVFSHANEADARSAARVLNGLSGVVAVDIRGAQTVAHCGDRLDGGTLLRHATSAGLGASMISEEYE